MKFLRPRVIGLISFSILLLSISNRPSVINTVNSFQRFKEDEQFSTEWVLAQFIPDQPAKAVYTFAHVGVAAIQIAAMKSSNGQHRPISLLAPAAMPLMAHHESSFVPLMEK
ncbi:MAG: hypothetical protein WKF87_04300 [Chryseolinea sp.]